ncbi:hypothetical protein [Mycobacteroides abscessus]|uniref:hypothetical protein n=1 Tax=Mycobacteroides abscessus TaxID=36809 RepID=UPI00078D63DF|nr:hypothetical protein [Mycobacteroides abscessus]QST89809.1 hypothetical protein PROPHIGD53-3_6 [Mycobacterium phage prophiGD53-3]AMU27662.1 hypothetical protein A3N96_21520 [Mycobacteroides abscessus]MDO3364003.1 hypothetical protein [Mycobacteroides abscessus subsp. massiliense]QSM73951.1 hypothetical protein I2T84_21655 [Mycobacteroides abscessus subsp. massiliense]SKI16530.1 Uncharacterised protein [Mycobacteroides abscessus subsp. massiliense]
MNLTKLFGFRRRVPETRNVLQLNKTIDRAGSVMDEFTATADAAGFDLGPDADGIELALMDFFTDRERRDEHSDVIKAGTR